MIDELAIADLITDQLGEIPTSWDASAGRIWADEMRRARTIELEHIKESNHQLSEQARAKTIRVKSRREISVKHLVRTYAGLRMNGEHVPVANIIAGTCEMFPEHSDTIHERGPLAILGLKNDGFFVGAGRGDRKHRGVKLA